MGNFVVSIKIMQEICPKNIIDIILVQISPYIDTSVRLDNVYTMVLQGCLTQELYITNTQNCDIQVKQQ